MLKFVTTKRPLTKPTRSHLLGFIIRQIDANAKMPQEVRLDAIASAVPADTLKASLAHVGIADQRRRSLPCELTLLLVVAMNLFATDSLSRVMIKLVQGLRFVWPDTDIPLPSKGAITQARYRLGARPAAELFHRVCRPMAKASTPGAFLAGLRLMAIDGTIEDVPDSPENDRVFGRARTDRGPAAFPQVKAVYLAEVGTHATVDAGFWPYHTSEHRGALRMLRSVHPGMLVMWDCGLHSFELVRRTRLRGAHLLGRVPANPVFEPVRMLKDGSFLSYIYPDWHSRHAHRQDQAILVRIIEYTITDPARQGCGQKHRLITSLLDAKALPALELVCSYHERWEWEITVDEMDTHQRLPNHPLRSKKPVGVIQELYGLLIAHYAVRKVMFEAAEQAGIDPDRLSFTNSLALVCNSIHEFQMVAAEQQPALYQRLLKDIARFRLPERANRINPRVVKRKMSKFNLKRKEHRKWPQPSGPFREAIAILN
jgi:hypothetical protein